MQNPALCYPHEDGVTIIEGHDSTKPSENISTATRFADPIKQGSGRNTGQYRRFEPSDCYPGYEPNDRL